MGRHIVKLMDGETGYYLVFSTVVDAPITRGMTLEELKAFWREERGRVGLEGLAVSLPRIEEKGTSCLSDESAAETVSCNRAGKDESCLSLEQIIDYYCRRCGQGDPPMGTKEGSDRP